MVKMVITVTSRHEMGPKKSGKEFVADEEFVTVNVLTEMLEQQKSFFKEMMDLQEKNFKSFLQLIMETTNKRVDNLVKEFTEYKQSLDYTQTQVDNQKKINDDITAMCKDARKDINTVCESALSLDGKVDYLEAQSKRNNLIIDGIPESKRESWQDTENKVRQVLSEKLGMNMDAVEVERAHRMGETTDGGRHRSIIVKFFRWKDKEDVMARANKLRGSNIYLNEDYSEAVRLRRKELIPIMKAERAKGNIAYIRYDKLIVHPPNQKPGGVANVATAPQRSEGVVGETPAENTGP